MSEKKGMFSKLGGLIFESDGAESSGNTYSAEELAARLAEINGTNPEVPEGMNMEDLITVDTVYEKFNLADKSRSIFRVTEFEAALPGSLPTDVKKQTLIGILTTSGLKIDELVTDGESRVAALHSTLDGFTQETTDFVVNKEAEIADLQRQMDLAKEDINNRKLLQENQEKLINEEITNVEKVVNFIKPTV